MSPGLIGLNCPGISKKSGTRGPCIRYLKAIRRLGKLINFTWYTKSLY